MMNNVTYMNIELEIVSILPTERYYYEHLNKTVDQFCRFLNRRADQLTRFLPYEPPKTTTLINSDTNIYTPSQ